MLAKTISPAIEAGVVSAGIPHSFVGVVIALLVLLPEGLSSTRSALRNRMQTSFNLVDAYIISGLGGQKASAALGVPIYPVDADGFALCDAMFGILPEVHLPDRGSGSTDGAEYYKYNPHKEG